ncbi:MAG: DUF3108 domain-containing protein [Nitrospiraceae bacterium]|nr:DUF3108 domain-containing protein [Nitrospiraceae bacterium]
MAEIKHGKRLTAAAAPFFLAVLLVAAILTGPAAAPAFQVPETLNYDISWAGIKAGESVINLDRKDNTFTITVTTQSAKWVSFFYRVNDRVETRIGAGPKPNTLGSPLTYTLNLSEGRHRKQKEVIFDHARSRAVYIDHLADERKEFDLPSVVFDPLSSFYQVRGMRLEVGESVYIRIFDSKKIYDAEVKVLRKERIKGPYGEVDTLVIKPIMKSEGIFYRKGEMLIWLTDDDKKVPVRMSAKVKIGSVTATLTGGHY